MRMCKNFKNYNFFLGRLLSPASGKVPSKARRQGQACVHRSEHLNLVSSARFFTSFKNDGKHLIPLCKKLSFVSAHTCPFRRLTPPPQPRQSVSLTFTASLRSSKSGSLASRQAGTALLYFFFRNQSARTAFLYESFRYFLSESFHYFSVSLLFFRKNIF